MVPLVVMFAGWVAFRVAAMAGVLAAADSWSGSLRFALALMFIFTGAAHFFPRGRVEMARMVPPGLPRPDLLVALTGILRAAGCRGVAGAGAGPSVRVPLIALLIAMFPANVHAARMHLTVVGRPATPLAIRLPLQLFWIGALWWVARVGAGAA